MAAETSTSQEKEAKKTCYERRTACIIKKSKELQILCGLKVGVVILGPDGKLESWPPQLSDVKALFDACKERPGVRSEKRKSPDSCREILVSKLQLLKQREEFFMGKEIAATSSEKGKGFGERCLQILNSKLQLLNNKEMVFCNRAGDLGKERIEDVLGPFFYDDDDLGGEYATMDDFFNSNYLVADPQDNGNVASVKGKEIATMENMDSGILQDIGAYECGENGEGNPGSGHHWSNSANHTLQPGSRVDACYQPAALDNGLPPTAAEQSGELQARLQNSTAASNNHLPAPSPTKFWGSLFMNAGLLNSTDAFHQFLTHKF